MDLRIRLFSGDFFEYRGKIMNCFNSYSQAAAITLAGLLFLLGPTGCSTEPTSVQGKSDLVHSSADTLDQAQHNDPTLRTFIADSAGYAVFPSVGKGAIGIGGAYGKGDVYQNGTVVGYCDMTQATIGLQLGGQDYSEIIVFETPAAVEKFKKGDFRFDAQATAVALKSGAGANAKFANGIAVFTMDEAGLMYEASIGGQKFSYLDK
jgi:lipid-binding SYLF domain-containing protein